MKALLFYILFFITLVSVAQRPAPAPTQQKPILILGGTAHIGDGSIIENSAIAFENGKLTVVSGLSNIRLDKSKFELIELKNNEHIYPGFILPNTVAGLEEIGAVRATLDYSETGLINSNIRSLIAYNSDSEVIPTLRFNGVLLAQVAPQGGLISGNSSIVQLDAWNWEDAAYKIDEGIHMNWPREKLPPRWWLGESAFRENKRYDSLVNIIDRFLLDAKSYAENRSTKTVNLKLEAAKGLFSGEKQLFIHVNNAKGIVKSVKTAKKYGVQKILLVGAEDILPVIDFVKDNEISVILNDVHSLPPKNGSSVDYAYELPKILMDEGIEFCLGFSNGPSNSRARNLPFYAGTTVAFGLSKEVALASITSQAAKILGIEDKTGALKEGLDANLIISEGDVLDMKESKIQKAFIQGREITLKAKQQKLYETYKNKYGQE